MENELDHADDCDVQVVNCEGKLDESIAEVENAIFGMTNDQSSMTN